MLLTDISLLIQIDTAAAVSLVIKIVRCMRLYVHTSVLKNKNLLQSTISQLFLITKWSQRWQMKGIAIYPCLVMPALAMRDLDPDAWGELFNSVLFWTSDPCRCLGTRHSHCFCSSFPLSVPFSQSTLS